jgi:putative intracellular protease/amidase
MGGAISLRLFLSAAVARFAVRRVRIDDGLGRPARRGLHVWRGAPLSVTGFSNLEEAAIELTDVVPFLVEDRLRNNGGNYSRKEKWQPYAVSDGDLITGQNPASSEAVAKALLDRLRIKGQARKVATSRLGAPQ